MRKKLIGGLAAAMLLVAVPALAHDGHGHRGHDRQWHGHGHHNHRHHVRERYVVREIVRPVPVYPQAYNPAPAAGIHVIFPSVFFPFN